jgi:uncharacterized protein YndB with AHSA1/START domain
MIWILTGVGVIVGVGLVVALAGSRLPRNHTARMTIQLAAPRDRVWALVSNFADAPRWRSDLRSVQLEPRGDGRLSFVETTRQGKVPFEVVSQEAPGRQVVRIVDDALPFGGTWTWELEAAGDGTRVTITEEGFIKNPVLRLMGRFFFKPTDSGCRYLSALAREVGESVEPEILQAR